MPGTQPLSVETLRRLEPIAGLSGERLNELAALCHAERIERNGDPLASDDRQEQAVYLLSGELKLSFADGSSSVLVGGSGVACWPLAERLPQVTEARAITGIEVLRIKHDTLDIMMTWDQLTQNARGRCETDELTDWRSTSAAFRVRSLTEGVLARLPAANVSELFLRFERIKLPAGHVVLHEGDEGDYYYIIESGRCEVWRKVGGADLLLAELKAGDAFGEEALVADSRRNASVRMKTGGTLLRLRKDDFIELLREPLLKRLTWSEAVQRVAEGACWLDVRYPSEYRQGRLPDAVNVPLGEIRNAIGLLDREREYIVYCQSGRRSSAAAFLLAQRGYQAYWLMGGLPDKVAIRWPQTEFE